MLVLLAWCGLSAGVAVLAGRAIKLAERRRPTYTPQLDVPLWRGTDLPDPGADLIHETWDEWPFPDPKEPPCPPSR
jgi:hypothetical protein